MAGGRIELISLTKQFAEIAAVDSIDLTISSGEFFSLLGPSGCGKTTTLRLIAGFEQPTAGRILLDDVDVSAVAPGQRGWDAMAMRPPGASRRRSSASRSARAGQNPRELTARMASKGPSTAGGS